jgi:pimeloyl-ACP methyl ester carboxylesterase
MAAVQFVYFHGQPGSPDELRAAFPDGVPVSKRLLVLNRACEAEDLPQEAYLDRLAGTILQAFPDGPLRLIGFSLGGVVVLEIALRLQSDAPEREISLDLIAAPAPLGDGEVLAKMAGGAVFALAKRHPWRFSLFTQAQGLLARIAPRFLLDQIFATAAGADAALSRDPRFQAILLSVLANTYRGRARRYLAEVRAYTALTGARYAQLRCPVRLWQGGADNWTPPVMAEQLATLLPQASLTVLPGLSHYSTLVAVLPQVLQDIEP